MQTHTAQHPINRRRCLAALVGCVAWPAAPAWAARHRNQGLMLAGEAAADMDPAGFLVSEKLDGARALWDGQQLRFRSGLPVQAPRWFTQALPKHPLDGELWMARGQFEALSGAVRRLQPDDSEWRRISYQVFDLPGAEGPFVKRAAALQALMKQVDRPALQGVVQRTVAGPQDLQRWLDQVVQAGGEGLMLHRADAHWVAGRSTSLLKLKPLHDAEAQVVAHLPGKGRHAGRLGALQVRTPEGVIFAIGTGLDDAQRDQPPPLGAWVTYSHRGYTAGGVPRFASFLRVRTL